MPSSVKVLIEASRQLPLSEQLQLLTALSESVYHAGLEALQEAQVSGTLYALNRTPPVADLDSFVADFWPEDETADDLSDFVHQQRQAERAADL